MKYSFMDLHNAYTDAEELLAKKNPNERILVIPKKYGRYNVESHNILSDKKIVLYDHITRDEVYTWLCGFNTGVINKPKLNYKIPHAEKS